MAAKWEELDPGDEIELTIRDCPNGELRERTKRGFWGGYKPGYDKPRGFVLFLYNIGISGLDRYFFTVAGDTNNDLQMWCESVNLKRRGKTDE